eukprot:1086765-Rhodomonas_salina.3
MSGTDTTSACRVAKVETEPLGGHSKRDRVGYRPMPPLCRVRHVQYRPRRVYRPTYAAAMPCPALNWVSARPDVIPWTSTWSWCATRN